MAAMGLEWSHNTSIQRGSQDKKREFKLKNLKEVIKNAVGKMHFFKQVQGGKQNLEQVTI
jgi:hypothetical protein